MKPYFLGIGAQKSATSWLYQCLREHPELCLAREKELHYFSDDALYAKGSAWYEAHFASCSGKHAGEISTSYLASPEAPERIKAYAPEMKLIALLRDPIERAESHVRHLISKGELPKDVRLATALRTRPDIAENGSYGAALGRYRACFPREQIFVGKYEEVVRDPQGLLDRVYGFLGVARQEPHALRARYNSSSFRALAAHGAMNRLYFMLNDSPAGRASLNAARALGLTSSRVADLGARLGENDSKLFTLSAGERAELRERYVPDQELLDSLV